jgi:hypothetical protein
MNTRHLALRLATLLAAVTLIGLSPARASVWYVKVGANGNGSDWNNACNLTYALTNAQAGDQAWLMQGSYLPPTNGGFVINTRLVLFGGFVGTETSVSGRSGSFLGTILEGDIGTVNDPTDNALHVVSTAGVAGLNGGPGVLLDGFLIQNGYALGAGAVGAGILSVQTDLDLVNDFLRHNFAPAASQGNKGGGLYFTSYVASVAPDTGFRLRIRDCEFEHNTGSNGGGIYGDRVRGVVVNTKFINNSSFPKGGGAFLTRMGTLNHLDFTDCTFYQNHCSPSYFGANDDLGGALYLGDTGAGTGGNVQVVNCAFASNYCNGGLDGQALGISANSLASVYNSIFYSNSPTGPGGAAPVLGSATIQYSDVEGGWGVFTDHNINANPLFRDLNAGLLSLKPASPCLDAADYSRLPADEFDLDGDGDRLEPTPIDLLYVKRLIDQQNVNDSGNGSVACSACTFLDMGAFERP